MIRAHCMGTEFPKRDTDSPKVEWVPAAKLYADKIMFDLNSYIEYLSERSHRAPMSEDLPSAADLDAVAEEQRVKEKTGMYYDKDGWYPPS